MPPLGAPDPDGDGSLPLLVENDQAIADAASPFGVNWSCRRFSILCLRPSLPAWGVFFVYSEKARRLRSARLATLRELLFVSLNVRQIPSGSGLAQANRGRETTGIRPSPHRRATD
jgi:hypothetical protein